VLGIVFVSVLPIIVHALKARGEQAVKVER
jgi:hypothetical protein